MEARVLDRALPATAERSSAPLSYSVTKQTHSIPSANTPWADTSLADGLWQRLQQEAQEQTDAVLAPLLRDIVLEQANLGHALSRLIARKFADEQIHKQALEELVRSFFLACPQALESVAADLHSIRQRDPAVTEYLTPLLFFKGFQAVQAHRVAHWLWQEKRRALAHCIQGRASELFAVDIHPGAVLGQRIMFDHGTGIVVGETAVIEDDVALLQNVTLGGTGKESGDRHPKIRRGVLIGTGAKILGNIEIGEGAKIGAGAIVIKPVEPFTTVVGNPARAVGPRHTNLPSLTMDQSLPALNYVI